ncbi:MAG: TRAP transporter large permease subunit, partial [Dehalococcoidia bacterium]|nr:TRAP transporter large permease subunit [Dehalococcoidia bacterium]
MDAVLVGYIGIAVLILALILRIPVAFCMILVGLAGSLYLLPTEAAFRLVVSDIFDKLGSYSLSVMPMFLLMGFFAAATGITQRLFKVTYDWVGWMRGGVAQATVIACALFSAVSGSSPATAAAIGAVAQPEMKKYKYDDKLAVGCIAGAGSLGPLIPPSGGMIIYGIITEQSIAQLFMAGILPGIMLAILFCLATYVLCRRNPDLGPAG